MDKRILYCMAGGGFYGVVDDEIFGRDEFSIHAKRVFSLEVVPDNSKIKRIGSENTPQFVISSYDNVHMNCYFISDLSEKSQLYQNIMSIILNESKAN